jgi:hypothetical protein
VEVLAVWRELGLLAAAVSSPPLLVSRRADAVFQVSLDVADTVDMLESIAVRDSSRIQRRRYQREAAGMNPNGSWIAITIKEVSGNATSRFPLQLLGRFLQQVFLAMNLAVPGSANFFSSRYEEVRHADYPPPQLSSDIFEGAYATALDRGWPSLRRLALVDVWTWLHDALSYDLDLAAEPVDKALFALLRVCESHPVDESDASNVLYITQAVEALFAVGRKHIGANLRARLEALLGEPPLHRGWFTKFYDLRSRIAHGGIPMLRPGAYFDWDDSAAVRKYITEFWSPVDTAIAVLLATLQDLIARGSRGYA